MFVYDMTKMKMMERQNALTKMKAKFTKINLN